MSEESKYSLLGNDKEAQPPKKPKVQKEATFMEIISPLSRCDKFLCVISTSAAIIASFQIALIVFLASRIYDYFDINKLDEDQIFKMAS